MKSIENYYEKYYPDYVRQNPDYKYDFYLKAVFKHSHPTSWLDFGCANGRFLSYLHTNHPKIGLYGVEINQDGFKSAQASLSDRVQLTDNIEHLSGRGLDILSAWDVLEHIDDVEAVLLKLKKTLNENGIIAAVMPVYGLPLGPIVHLLDKDPTHVQKHSYQFWLDLFEKHFEILEWQGIFRILLAKKWYVHQPTRFLRTIAPAILIIAKKH